ncbi:DinB family protein, partial [Rhizobium ruizarguesonis]
MLRHYRMFAAYNRWANTQVYAAAAELSDAEFRSDHGAFFGSLHRTLNH